MSVVLTYVEADSDGPSKLSSETATLARGLAESSGAELQAAVVGVPSDALIERLGVLGVSTLHSISHALLADYAPGAWGESLAQLTDGLDVAVVVGPGSERGAEVMAHVAARLDRPLAANCIEVSLDDGGWSLTRIRWGGMLLEDAKLEADLALLSVAPHQIGAADADSPEQTQVVTFTPQVDEALTVTRVRQTASRGGGISLATAPVVVSGGRGVGSAEGFAILEELAELVGGAVGCSRVATNNGWRSHNDQVGQTGTRVAPDLYIACGISGATQHWVGCMSSKKILAINTDAEAPMVTRADYAVIGDLHELLEAVVEKVRQRTGAA